MHHVKSESNEIEYLHTPIFPQKNTIILYSIFVKCVKSEYTYRRCGIKSPTPTLAQYVDEKAASRFGRYSLGIIVQ
jgi:hypothetical protein